MTGELPSPPRFWATVRLLLAVARKRGVGRRKRQQQLFSQRAGKKARNWAGIGSFFVVFLMALLNGAAAFLVIEAVKGGERQQFEQQGRIAADAWFISRITDAEKRATSHTTGPNKTSQPSDRLQPAYPQNFSSQPPDFRTPVKLTTGRGRDKGLDESYRLEAKRLSRDFGGDEAALETKLRDAAQSRGSQAFIAMDSAAPGLTALSRFGRCPAMLGSLALLIWGAMLVCQGEGLELDVQRRRHPMWEWLFSHPAPIGAVFLAEMLAPIAANPIYYSAPLFPAILYGAVYGAAPGIAAAFLVGAPVVVAAACLGKALEIAITLRFSPRSRGAMIGVLGWFGFASLMMIFVAAAEMRKMAAPLTDHLQPLTAIGWPWLGLFLGQQADGSFSFLAGMFACWVVAALVIAAAVSFSIWGAQQGLDGKFDRSGGAFETAAAKRVRFGKDPLYAKELAWFARDRSAIVQAILIPLSMAGLQMFNMRNLLAEFGGAWNTFCGAAILFGTFFLTTLGPKSLVSEGPALWIALTWPRGLESLLKAKARLWATISSVLVGVVLCCAVWLFPASFWKIALVALGWFIFAQSLAEKSVTLVSAASESGETEKISWGRRYAVSLGTMTFSIGVFTQQWTLAVTGIVYSIMTAAGMWQNFRAHLPYLYDPWSERLPPPPSLMHAMIAISALVEICAVASGVSILFLGRNNLAVAQTIGYGAGAVIVSLSMANFLRTRGIAQSEIWLWRTEDLQQASSCCGRARTGAGAKGLMSSLAIGVISGLALGLLGLAYLKLLHLFPLTAGILDEASRRQSAVPHLQTSLLVMGVLFAPIAEEYLFRGMLYRALDREWGGWLAVVGSAVFFAIYHPPLAWLPVALVGICNALLFKQTGRLAPAVALHMVYNAVVLI